MDGTFQWRFDNEPGWPIYGDYNVEGDVLTLYIYVQEDTAGESEEMQPVEFNIGDGRIYSRKDPSLYYEKVAGLKDGSVQTDKSIVEELRGYHMNEQGHILALGPGGMAGFRYSSNTGATGEYLIKGDYVVFEYVDSSGEKGPAEEFRIEGESLIGPDGTEWTKITEEEAR